MIQAKFKELTVLGLHDDITIIAHRRQDFGKLMEAAKVMKPVLFGQGSRMNMAKTRFVYYGESELTEEVTEAIREAGSSEIRKIIKTQPRRVRTEGTTTYIGSLWDQIEMR